MRKITGSFGLPQDDRLEWGDFVDVKINAPDLVPEKTQKYKDKEVFLSSDAGAGL